MPKYNDFELDIQNSNIIDFKNEPMVNATARELISDCYCPTIDTRHTNVMMCIEF